MKRVRSYAISVLLVALTTSILWFLHAEKAHQGLAYLLAVSMTAVIGGTETALFAAILSFLTWNFFLLPPLYTFVLSDSRDWILLFSFLAMAILVGQIAGRMRAREEEAREKEKKTTSLYQAVLAINSRLDTGAAFEKLLEQVVRSTHAVGAAIVLNDAFKASFGNDFINRETEEQIEWVIQNAKALGLGPPPQDSSENPWPISVPNSKGLEIILPLITDEETAGALVVLPEPNRTFDITERKLLVAFSQMASMFLERLRLLAEESKAAGMRESERLKSILFSSLSHNLKTPLASLATTVSTLQESNPDLEEIKFMKDDIDRLTENIDNLLHLAELESGEWMPNLEPIELQEIIGTALRPISEKEYQRIKIDLSGDLPLLLGDASQLSQAFGHIVENALTYSPHNSKIRIGAKRNKNKLEIWIDDEGPGIPVREREDIFRKFFRGEFALKKSIRGTGLGLSICKEIILSHHGTIAVQESPFGGTRIRIELPLAERAELVRSHGFAV